MLLLAKGHYQATLGWVMGPLLRLWRWFIALFSKPRYAKKSTQSARENTIKVMDTTRDEEALAISPESSQQPPVYLYNLSRSSWTNQLNLDWIYLDTHQRGENRFILFVNVEPEEQNEVYEEELRIALANMQDVMTRRNEHPLLYAVDDLQTTGELVVLDRTQPLNQMLTNYAGQKRVLFAGGNKLFYRELSQQRIDAMYVCQDEGERITLIAEAIGGNTEGYINDYLAPIQDFLQQSNIELATPINIAKRIRMLTTLNHTLSRKMVKRKRPFIEPKSLIRDISIKLERLVIQLGEYRHDLRINADVRLTPDMDRSLVNLGKFENFIHTRREFRNTTKTIQSITITFVGDNTVLQVPDEKGEPNTCFVDLAPHQTAEDNEVIYHYSFDSRNFQRSIYQLLVLLSRGQVRMEIPHSLRHQIENTFVLESHVGGEIVLVLNNRKGDELKSSFGTSTFNSSVLVAEVAQELDFSYLGWCLTVAHMIRMGLEFPIRVQHWPHETQKNTTNTASSLRVKRWKSKLQFKSFNAQKSEGLLERSLTLIENDPPSKYQHFSLHLPEKLIEVMVNGSEMFERQFHSVIATSDATCFLETTTGERLFINFDVTVAQDIHPNKHLTFESHREKFAKYHTVEFGKSFLSGTVIVIFTTIQISSAEYADNLQINAVSNEKLLIVNLSTTSEEDRPMLSPSRFADILRQVLDFSNNSRGLEVVYNSANDESWETRVID